MKGCVAILGATGFIGRAVTSLFIENEFDIYACSKNGGSINEISIDKVNLLDNIKLTEWFKNKNIDHLIYLSSQIPNSAQEANWELFHNNLIMHKNILDLWKKQKFHLVYASGTSVYGNQSPIPWKEENMTFPENYYTLSKLIGENLFYIEHQNGLPLTILRISSPFGIGSRRKTVINIFIENAIKGNDLKIFGSGNREQDFIYVLDIAQAFLNSYQKKKYGIFNIASGKTVTMKDLANIIIKLTESTVNTIYSREPDPQEGYNVNIDVSKAKLELGFESVFSLEDGLKEIIRQYKEV